MADGHLAHQIQEKVKLSLETFPESKDSIRRCKIVAESTESHNEQRPGTCGGGGGGVLEHLPLFPLVPFCQGNIFYLIFLLNALL